jgi:FtsH-binding integral membrane protein
MNRSFWVNLGYGLLMASSATNGVALSNPHTSVQPIAFAITIVFALAGFALTAKKDQPGHTLSLVLMWFAHIAILAAVFWPR